jgi:hypothetical protein
MNSLCFLLMVLPALAGPVSEKSVQIYTVTAEGDYDEYKELLKLAISNRGVKISNTSHISDMLQRTREAVGATGNIFTHAEAIEFCSATLSRQMMAADAHNVLYCPYIIYIYELAGEEGKIYLAFRKLPLTGSQKSRQAIERVNKMLTDIILETLE